MLLSLAVMYLGLFFAGSMRSDGSGDVLFPAQIIVTNELDKENHCSLRVLTRDADEDDIRLFLTEALSESDQDDRANVDAILQVSVAANMELFERIRRDEKMCQALRELMKDEIAKDFAEGHAQGLREGLREGQREGLHKGRIIEAVDIYRDELGLDEQSIITRISSKFNLSSEQAKTYVLCYST